MKIYIFIILAAATSISLISCDSKQSDTRSASSTEVHRNDDGHDHRESDGDNHSEIENMRTKSFSLGNRRKLSGWRYIMWYPDLLHR